MTRCGESGPHGIMTGMPQCILKHLHRSARTFTAPKTLFLGFFVQASVKVLFLTLFFHDATSITIASHCCEVLFLRHYVSHDHQIILQAKIRCCAMMVSDDSLKRM
jgi:hypothetical protein